MANGGNDQGEAEKKHYVLKAEPGQFKVGGSATVALIFKQIRRSRLAFLAGLLFAVASGVAGVSITWPNPYCAAIVFSILVYLLGYWLLPPTKERITERR